MHLAGKGEQRAMGEVGAVEHAVGQRVAEGEQRVDRADMQAVQELLEEVEHASVQPHHEAREP